MDDRPCLEAEGPAAPHHLGATMLTWAPNLCPMGGLDVC